MEPDGAPHVDPPATPMSLRRTWDPVRERTARLHSVGCHAALLDWQPQCWPDDGGLPVEIARALGLALTALGTVMARTDGTRTGPSTTLIPPPRRPVLHAVHDALLRRGPAAVLPATRGPADAAALLDCGWAT